jgi:hypothetical protein
MSGQAEPITTEAVLATLIESGLGELLDNDEVCTTLKQGLREAGCAPPTHIIVFALLKKGLVLGWDFGGTALRSRLLQWLGRSETLLGLLIKVGAICRDHKDADAVNQMMLAHLRGERGTAAPPEIDDTTDGAVLAQLYAMERFNTLDSEIGEIANLLQDLLIERSTSDAIDTRLGWAEGGSASLADAIRYNSGNHRFTARHDEIALLHRFWYPSGVGRLARVGGERS